MKTTILFVLGLFLVSTLAFSVMAQKDKIEATTATETTETATTAKQPMGQTTFLQCVSDAAAVKNTCYGTSSDKKTTCLETASAQTDVKTANKACAADYKKEKAQCKTDFKKTKNECKKIKHSFLDSIRASFK